MAVESELPQGMEVRSPGEEGCALLRAEGYTVDQGFLSPFSNGILLERHHVVPYRNG